MIDIVRRLREGRTEGTDLRWQPSDIHREAAAEIERLRAGWAAERDRCCTIVHGVCSSDNEAQRIVNAIRGRNETGIPDQDQTCRMGAGQVQV